MDCTFIKNNFFGILDNTLSDPERTGIENHIASCPECSKVISEFRKTINNIETDISIEINPFAGTRILQHIESVWSLHNERSQLVFSRVLQPVVLTFSLLLAVLIGFSLGRKGVGSLTGKTSADQDIQSIRSELYISDITDEDKTLFINP